MKKILLLIASLVMSAQAVCAQVSEVEKKKLEEQVVLAVKKYEGLGLSTEELAEKVAADLLMQAQVLQDDEAVEAKSNFNKKLMIGAVAAVVVCGVGYYVYTNYFAKKSLEQAADDFAKAVGEEISSERREDIRELMKKNQKRADDLAAFLSKLTPKVAGKSIEESRKIAKAEYANILFKNPPLARDVRLFLQGVL